MAIEISLGRDREDSDVERGAYQGPQSPTASIPVTGAPEAGQPSVRRAVILAKFYSLPCLTKHFQWSNSFNFHNNPKKVLLPSPFYR